MNAQTLAAAFTLTLTGASALAPSSARADLNRVWATDDGSKIAEDALEHPAAAGNLTFDPAKRHVRLFGGRNEIVAFQVVLEGGAAATTVQCRFAELTATGGSAIRNRDGSAPGEFAGRHIDLFLEKHLRIEERSRDIGWAPDSPAIPSGFDGVAVPDPLVPIASGADLSVPAKKNRIIWVDIYIPRDATPGIYRGQFGVEGASCSSGSCNLELELEVLDFTLPERPTARTMLWFAGGDNDRDVVAARYVDDPFDSAADEAVIDLRRKHFQLARRHRIGLFSNHHDAPGNEELARRLRGEEFTPAAGYTGPGEGLGQELYAIHAYGAAELTPEKGEAWKAWLDSMSKEVDYFFYVEDEPPEDRYPEVTRKASESGPIPTFTTAPYHDALEVDIHAALPGDYEVNTAKRVRDLGRRYWIYNGERPFSGTFLTDDVAVAPRVNAWIQHKYGIGRWFYWDATYYKDAQGGKGNVDVLTTARNFSNKDGDVANGDGLLIYPGTDLLFPESSVGLSYPLPSVRLKNWRRGIQDVEYLAAARAAGHGEFVDALLAAMLPMALADELSSFDPVPWSENGEDWLRARRLLADAISSGKPPTIPEELVREFTPRKVKRQRMVIAAGAGLLFLVILFGFWRWRRRRHMQSS